MTVGQPEIDALLGPADDSAPASEPRATPALATPPPRPAARLRATDRSRVLRLRVPVIVQLAARRMPVADLRGLSVGTIIEFDKSVEESLELLVNNHRIGHGEAVKVGENFGLRLAGICSRSERVRSLGA